MGKREYRGVFLAAVFVLIAASLPGRSVRQQWGSPGNEKGSAKRLQKMIGVEMRLSLEGSTIFSHRGV